MNKLIEDFKFYADMVSWKLWLAITILWCILWFMLIGFYGCLILVGFSILVYLTIFLIGR